MDDEKVSVANGVQDTLKNKQKISDQAPIEAFILIEPYLPSNRNGMVMKNILLREVKGCQI